MVCGCVGVRSAGDGEVVQEGDAGAGGGQGVAGAAAVAQDLVGLHACQGVFDAGTDLAVDLVEVFLLVRQSRGLGALAVGHDHAGVGLVAAIGHHRSACRDIGDAGATETVQSLRLPGCGSPVAITRRVSASMATCRLVEYR